MTARRAIVFISIAAILAGVFSLSAAVLTRWMANVPPAAPLDVPLASLSLPLDAQGLGTQVIEGTSLTIRVQPYPPIARAPVTVTLVAIGPNGGLLQFVPAVSVSALNQVAGPGAPMRRLSIESSRPLPTAMAARPLRPLSPSPRPPPPIATPATGTGSNTGGCAARGTLGPERAEARQQGYG